MGESTDHEAFEAKLRELRLREPSAEMDRAVKSELEDGAERPTGGGRDRRNGAQPLWAIAAAVAMGLTGFAAGRLSAPEKEATQPEDAPVERSFLPRRPPATPSMATRVEVMLIAAPASNPFDLTVPTGMSERGAPRGESEIEQ